MESPKGFRWSSTDASAGCRVIGSESVDLSEPMIRFVSWVPALAARCLEAT
jgi:hypothetical protein